jgi:hypothetical protein
LKAQAYSKACAEEPPLADRLLDFGWEAGFVAKVGELSHVVGVDGVDPIGDSLDQASQEVRGRGRITFLCSSTKANFDVRSIARMRRSLPSAI